MPATTEAASLGCARCGACCDPVPLDRASYETAVRWSSAALSGVPDPGTEDGWAYWLEHGWAANDRDRAEASFRPGSRMREDGDFISAHWKTQGDRNCTCDAYDRETRSCTAQDSKPPVCRDYPWYGREPEHGRGMPSQCSYLADLPPDRRPEGSRPLIPLTVL